jgi:phage baseplate assembly protein W
MNIDFPLRFDQRGLTAEVGYEKHVRNLIEQVLFTAPGERVNRPDFGSGLMQLVFSPNSPELAAATQFLVQGALQRWLGDLIEVRNVQVEAVESSLLIQVDYLVRRTQEREVIQLTRSSEAL